MNDTFAIVFLVIVPLQKIVIFYYKRQIISTYNLKIKQCDQMMEYKVAPFFTNVAQKVSTEAFT